MADYDKQDVMEWAPHMDELLKVRGWQLYTERLKDMKAELVQALAYSAEEKDIPFLRGQLVCVDSLIDLPNKIVQTADALRSDIDAVEKARRAARAKMRLPMQGEVTQ